MELKRFRHLWGIDEPWESVFPKIKALGYAGVEAPLPAAERAAAFRALLQEHGLAYIPMIFTKGAAVDDHLASFREQVETCLTFSPRQITSHSGFDGWTEAESSRYFASALEFEAAQGAVVAHETHRGRILFHPWVTARLVERFEALKLCCDLSHWVCVCERLIDDQQEVLERCARRTIHIHARVGYEEGPQVPDPRAPEYQRHVEAHERWWDLIWAAQKQRGMTTSTLTPEYGPPAYLHTLPYTQAPVADLWDICNWQAQREAERFAAQHGA